MFEARNQELIPLRLFYIRLFRYSLIAFAIVTISLLVGVLGYHLSEGLPWLDALLNASMILSGMGPVNELHTVPGKLFASFYSLFSGVVFITTVGLLFAPIFHRFIHKFHLDMEEKKDSKD